METEHEKILADHILERLPDSIIITNQSEMIINWLAASEKIFGFKQAEVQGKSLKTFLNRAQEDLNASDEFSDGIICRNKSNSEIIIRIVHKESFKDKILWICRDITAFKKIEYIMNTYHDDVHDELEKLVEKKTADLIKLNEELEERVKNRTRELEIMQKKLVERAHRAGMAEVAIRNLHNIGNILNNIATSIFIIDRSLKELPIDRLNRANSLLEKKLLDIKGYLKTNSNWDTLIDYYNKIEDTFRYKSKNLLDTIIRLERKVEEINYIISDQNQYANYPALFDNVDVRDLFEDILNNEMSAIEENNIRIIKEYDIIPDIKVQKLKLNYIITCLIRNAVESMKDNKQENRILTLIIKKMLTMTAKNEEISILIQIKDTGRGIEKGNLKKIFNQGFSSYNDKSGVSLHTCANYINEMRGKIIASSKGTGNGATFTILLNPEL